MKRKRVDSFAEVSADEGDCQLKKRRRRGKEKKQAAVILPSQWPVNDMSARELTDELVELANREDLRNACLLFTGHRFPVHSLRATLVDYVRSNVELFNENIAGLRQSVTRHRAHRLAQILERMEQNQRYVRLAAETRLRLNEDWNIMRELMTFPGAQLHFKSSWSQLGTTIVQSWQPAAHAVLDRCWPADIERHELGPDHSTANEPMLATGTLNSDQTMVATTKDQTITRQLPREHRLHFYYREFIRLTSALPPEDEWIRFPKIPSGSMAAGTRLLLYCCISSKHQLFASIDCPLSWHMTQRTVVDCVLRDTATIHAQGVRDLVLGYLGGYAH